MVLCGAGGAGLPTDKSHTHQPTNFDSILVCLKPFLYFQVALPLIESHIMGQT